jgi:hypothetical protein
MTFLRRVPTIKILTLIVVLISFSACVSLSVSATKSQSYEPTVLESETPKLVRHPYLQTAWKDSISILWHTDMGTKAAVRFGKTIDLNQIAYGNVIEDESIIKNEVTLKGLERGETYYYEILTDYTSLAKGVDYSFTTESEDSQQQFSFYAMGDIGEPVTTGGFPEITSHQINRLNTRPNFGIGLGDIIYPDGESKYADDYLFKPLQPILRNIPFYPALGNHDWHVNPDENFTKEWKLPHNEHYYTFDYQNAHFIALDTRNGDLFEPEKQLVWLETQLQKAQNKYDWIFVYFHHNGKTCTYKKDNLAVMSLYPLFAKYNVDIVFNGHAHTYERLQPFNQDGQVIESLRKNNKTYPEIKNGFIQITTGAGGKLKGNWQPPVPGTCDKNIVAANAHTGHFSIITIEGKKLNLKAISALGGFVLDEFTMDKN